MVLMHMRRELLAVRAHCDVPDMLAEHDQALYPVIVCDARDPELGQIQQAGEGLARACGSPALTNQLAFGRLSNIGTTSRQIGMVEIHILPGLALVSSTTSTLVLKEPTFSTQGAPVAISLLPFVFGRGSMLNSSLSTNLDRNNSWSPRNSQQSEPGRSAGRRLKDSALRQALAIAPSLPSFPGCARRVASLDNRCDILPGQSRSSRITGFIPDSTAKIRASRPFAYW